MLLSLYTQINKWYFQKLLFRLYPLFQFLCLKLSYFQRAQFGNAHSLQYFITADSVTVLAYRASSGKRWNTILHY